MVAQLHNRILLTGAGGNLGSQLQERLHKNCKTLRLSDFKEFKVSVKDAEVMLADLADSDAVDAMVAGVDAIVHMGGISVEGPFNPILQANILGAYNLYEAARKHGVKRIIFASSNHVTGFYKQSETITTKDPARPDGMYGLSKVFGESLSRYYYDRFGIETVCIRIGSSFPEPRDRRMLVTWLSYDDLHRLIVSCLKANVVAHSIIFASSNNKTSWWDNSSSKHIGYAPEDSSEIFSEKIYSSTSEPDLSDPVNQYQGGGFVVAGPFGLN